jgi:hypothetical protein
MASNRGWPEVIAETPMPLVYHSRSRGTDQKWDYTSEEASAYEAVALAGEHQLRLWAYGSYIEGSYRCPA